MIYSFFCGWISWLSPGFWFLLFFSYKEYYSNISLPTSGGTRDNLGLIYLRVVLLVHRFYFNQIVSHLFPKCEARFTFSPVVFERVLIAM